MKRDTGSLPNFLNMCTNYDAGKEWTCNNAESTILVMDKHKNIKVIINENKQTNK